MKAFILFFTVAVCISACQRDEQPQTPANECVPSTQIPPGYMLNTLTAVNHDSMHCGYMPLGKKNYWIYLDSLFNNNGQFLQTVIDTLRFTSTYRSTDSLIWWKPSSLKGFLNYNYSTKNVLYTLGNRWGYGLSVEWAYSITNDSSEYSCAYADHPTECKAWKLNTPVVVPAGNFSGCFRYLKVRFFAQDMDIHFKPGVGILKFRFYTSNPGGSITLARTSTLLSYFIE